MASTTPAHGLSPRAERFIRVLSAFAVLVLAVGAAVLSFSGLVSLAATAGFPPVFAWLLPVIIDGMVLTGSLGVVAADLVGISTWYPWSLTILGVILSVWGNVVSAPQNLTAQAVHAIAPLTFALSIEGMLRIYRAAATATLQREQTAAAADERRAEREARAHERAMKAQAAALAPQAAPTTPAAATVIAVQAGAPVVHNGGAGNTARARIVEYLKDNPEATGGSVARALDLDPSYTRKIIRELKDDEPVLSGDAANAETASDN
jgi:Protein of unknown function (DUF2637)